jgi:DNA-binding NarL/FixJ family response regulator
LPASPIRTLLVHDRVPANHPVFEAVSAHARLLLVGTVWTTERLEQALRLQSPELALVDWQLAATPPSQVCHVIKSRLLAPRLVAVVPEDDLFHRHSAALAGADGLMSKHAPADSLARVLATVFGDRIREA